MDVSLFNNLTDMSDLSELTFFNGALVRIFHEESGLSTFAFSIEWSTVTLSNDELCTLHKPNTGHHVRA